MRTNQSYNAPATGSGCYYTSTSIASFFRHEEYPADYAVCQTLTTELACSTAAATATASCAWRKAPHNLCDVRPLKSLEEAFTFSAPRLSHYLVSDIVTTVGLGYLGVIWMVYCELLGLWTKTSQLLLTMAYILAMLQAHKAFGEERNYAKAGFYRKLVFALLSMLGPLLLRPRWVRFSLMAKAVLTTVSY